MQRGISFMPPRTRSEASRLIDQLKRRTPNPRDDQRRDVRAVQDALATQRGDAASVRSHELEGHGSTATWKDRS